MRIFLSDTPTTTMMMMLYSRSEMYMQLENHMNFPSNVAHTSSIVREKQKQKKHMFLLCNILFFFSLTHSRTSVQLCVCAGGCIEIFIKLMDGIKSFAHAQN